MCVCWLQSPLWDPGSGLAAASIRVVYFILRPVAKKVLFFLHSCKALLDPHHGGVWVVCGWCVGALRSVAFWDARCMEWCQGVNGCPGGRGGGHPGGGGCGIEGGGRWLHACKS
jgi:hypothetical protein